MKIRKSILLALSIFLICISALYSQSSSGNLAYEKLIVASSQENLEHEADKAVDGNSITYWSSLSGVDPSWIYVDLGKTYHIDQVILNWASAYASSYQVQISDDAITWTDIYSTDIGDGGIDNITGLAVDGRYVRIYGTVRATADGYSLYEIEIYGSGLEATSTGDINNDGNVNILDALFIARYYVKLPVPGFIEPNGDANCDGNVNILDALLVARYYVQLIEKPNCIVTDTQFLYGRGFYVTPFTEVITTATVDAEIVYTLDGSDPRSSSTAINGASPLEVQIDPSNSTNRPLTPAITLRACAIKTNWTGTNIDTQTYIFIEKVKTQGNASPGGGWPEPNSSGTGQALDFGMDPDIVDDPQYQDLMTDALTSIPSLSLVTDLENLFDATTGIYTNVDQHGRAWERLVSMEILDPDGPEVQAYAGIRIRGDWDRQEDNPKHSFQLLFRDEYGDAKLNYKLFDDEGVEEFDKIDLRTATNYNWAYYGDNRNAMVRDVLCRDLQGKTGQPYTKSRYYHLYLNGLYWGLYQSQEKSEAKYARAYFGGERQDYDVIKSGGVENNYLIEATDGTLDLTNLLQSKMIAGFVSNDTYFDVLGRNPDGSVNPAGQKLVDPENLIDYMLNIFYSGDKDGPISTFINGGEGINNFYGIINRNNPDGFKWFHHEAEHTLDLGDTDRIGPFPSTALNQPGRFNPQTLNEYLMENTEYQMLFADRAYRYFLLDDGTYAPGVVSTQLNLRTGQIDPGAVIAHSARWGDTITTTPLDYNNDWLPTINNILTSFIPTRSSQIIDLLKQKDWYPDIDPPTISSAGQTVNSRITDLVLGTEITLASSSGGTIYYTTDGSDPRATGGSISSSAFDGGTSTTISLQAAGIKARIQNSGQWSPVRELYNITPIERGALQITEIHYNPAEESGIDESDFEFVEIWNSTAAPLNLTGVNFSKGILYNFPAGTVIPAHGYLVLASVPLNFVNRYGFEPFDQYDGQLENGGDKLTLRDAFDTTIFSVQYNDSPSWPQTPDGAGNSLVPIQYNSALDPDDNEYWTASAQVNGSPGAQDANTIVGDAPVAAFITSTITPALSELITFDASSSTDTDGTIVSYEWDFGDGNTATGPVVGHSFVFTEDYNVQLIVTDDTGLTDSIRNYIFVERPDGWTEDSHSAAGGAEYELLFDNTVVHRIDITIDPGIYTIMEDDMTMIYGTFGGGGTQDTGDDPIWSPVTIDFNGKTWWNVGMRYKGIPGAWHEGIHKLAFRLDFDQFEDNYSEILDQRFYGFKKMTFSNAYQDISLIRDKLAADIFRAGGVPAAYGSFCRIYVDSGSGPVYWGLYTMVEDPTNKMLDDQFTNDNGNMYKPEGPGAAWTYPFDQTAFIKRTNEEEADYSDVIAAHSALHGDKSNQASWRAVFEYYFNTGVFIKWLAINTIIQNWDSYGIMPWNYYLYQDLDDSGRLVWIPWDLGESFKVNGELQPLSLSLDEVSNQWPLIRYLMDDPVYRDMYNTELQLALNGCFASEDVSTKIQSYHNLISPYVVGIDGEISGYTFLTSDNDFLTSLIGGPDALQTHVENRHTEVNSYLSTQ